MRELLLSVLGVYLLTRTKENDPTAVGNIPIYETDRNNAADFGKKLDKNQVADLETRYCPWFWLPWKRPAVYSTVPISPGSAQRWKDLCRVWLKMRQAGKEIKVLEPIVNQEKQPVDIKKLQDLKNYQAFLFSETKRLAKVQNAIEASYLKALKLRFSNNDITGFYKTRKEQLYDGLWPKVETQLVPPSAIDWTVPADIIVDEPGMNDDGSKPRVDNTIDYQRDIMRAAEPCGLRVTPFTKYYEYRSNRCDEYGKTI